jgi:O-antigen biosynthesis protein
VWTAKFAALGKDAEQFRKSKCPRLIKVSHSEINGAAKRENRPLNVLVVHEILPHPDRHGADVQWMQMLQELRAQGHNVVHIARSGVNRERYAPGVEALGIKVFAPDAERSRFLGVDYPVEWTLDQLLHENQFDLAILFHWFWNGLSIPEHYMEEIRRASPKTFIAVLTDDQQGLREMQKAQLTGQWLDYEHSYDYSNRELAVYRRADVVLTISEDDSRAFLRAAPELRTGRMPMIATVSSAGGTYMQRRGLLFLANFDNKANRDACDWMLREIWPRIHEQIPSAELALVGNNLPREVGANQRGVLRVGYVEDLETVFVKCRVALSPVRFGTGIKTKNLFALAHGVPLVTTTVGADGMSLRNHETALIEDQAREFADAAVRVYEDEALWQKLARQGRQHIVEEFSEERMQEAVYTLVHQAKTLKPKAYDPNFVWPYRLVERRFPEVINGQPAVLRNFVRLGHCFTLAEEFLEQQRPREALEQLRFVFSHVQGRVPSDALFLRVVQLMARCYVKIGDKEKAAQYAARAGRCLGSDESILPPSAGSRNGKKYQSAGRGLAFSVIVPTFNRKSVLAECLEALARQSFPGERFEVIVVDDGSTDETEQFCRGFRANYSLMYLRQLNAGAGAARRRGVKHAGGQYLLLINDDTIGDPGLLAAHWEAHQVQPDLRKAVLGDFRFPAAAENHALTRFLSSNAFFFPQQFLKPGRYWQYDYIVTCNLSVGRQGVLDAGSFDPNFRVAEDTELGVRLNRKGFCVTYVPAAQATHQHLPFTIPDLIRRAVAYGGTQLALLRKHPALLGQGRSVFGMLDEKAADAWRSMVSKKKQEIESMVGTLKRIDSVDFAPFLTIKKGEGTMADEIGRLFQRMVPDVYWHYFFSELLRTWEEEPARPSMASLQAAIAEDQAFI